MSVIDTGMFSSFSRSIKFSTAITSCVYYTQNYNIKYINPGIFCIHSGQGPVPAFGTESPAANIVTAHRNPAASK